MKKKNTRRNKGEGSITQLPSGKFKMTITIGTTIDGKQKRKSITASTRKELLLKASQLRVTYGLMTEEEKEQENNNVTFEEFAIRELQLQETHLSYNTYRSYLNIDTQYLIPYVGHLKLRAITPNMCTQLLEGLILEKRLSNATIRSIRRRFNSLLMLAVKKDIIKVNPMSKVTIKIPQGKRKAERFILPTMEEMNRLLEYLKENRPHLFPFVYTAVFTGMRKGELIGLTWDCVNFEEHTITINKQITTDNTEGMPLKTESSYRTIYLSEKCFTVLKDIPHVSKFVFYTPKSHTHLYLNVTRDIQEICKRIGMPKGFTFHDIRHFHATQLIKNNVNIKVVSRRLGHKNINTTLDLYFNYMPSMDEQASKVLDTLVY